MKKGTSLKIICVCILLSFGSLSVLLIHNSNVKAQPEPPISDEKSYKINPNEFTNITIPPTIPPFPPLFELDILSNVSIDLTMGFKGAVTFMSRQMYLKINATRPVTLNVTAEFNYESYIEDFSGDFNLTDVMDAYSYNCFYHIYTNETISNLQIYFRKDNDLFEPTQNYSLGIYERISGNWNENEVKLTEVKEQGNEYLVTSMENFEGGKDYYLTPYTSSEPAQPISPPDFDWLLILIPGIIIVAVLAVIIAKKDYIKYLKKRIVSIDKGAHRLTMDEVLENKNRSKIIDIILKNPGIHFNELKRKTGLASGNLVWHLDILETYKVIKKKRVKNYVIYIPYYTKNPLSNLDLKLQKSELTLEVLEMIEENPGIWNAKITDKLETHRKTIQYHIDKLIDLDLVHKERDGIKKKIYPNLEAEYFKDNITDQENPEEQSEEEK